MKILDLRAIAAQRHAPIWRRPMSDHEKPTDHGAEDAPLVDGERRDALQRIAHFGAYTAPALLVMLTSEKAPAQTDASAPT
jgi:hypothetical protein